MNKPKNPPAKRSMTWYRMDLHIHTPASADYKDRNVTYLQILQKAESRGLDIIGITDHNTVAGWAAMYEEVETLLTLERLGRLNEDEARTLAEYRRLADKMMVLPGFEITATLGFHILGLFPPGTSVRKLEHILLDLNIPEDKLDLGVGEVGSTADVLTVYRTIAEAGGLVIAAHANSTHGVAMQGYDFGGQTRIAYTQDKNLHALEVTDLESTSRKRTANFFNGSRPEYPRRMHCIQGSDAHRLDRDPKDKSEPFGIGDRATEVLLPELSFEALKGLFLGNDFSRIRPARPLGVIPQPVFDPIKAARKQGPDLVQSFYEHFSPKPSRLAAIIADVVAMANTNGGTIYIGVNASPKPPVYGVEKPEEAIAILRREMQKAITPPLDVTIEVAQSEGKNVVVLRVPKGPDAPYVLSTGQIYVRLESETTLALRDEIIRLVLASHRPEPAPPSPLTLQMPVAPPAPMEMPIAPSPISPPETLLASPLTATVPPATPMLAAAETATGQVAASVSEEAPRTGGRRRRRRRAAVAKAAPTAVEEALALGKAALPEPQVVTPDQAQGETVQAQPAIAPPQAPVLGLSDEGQGASPSPVEAPDQTEVNQETTRGGEPAAETPALAVEPPRTKVEILAVEEQGGV